MRCIDAENLYKVKYHNLPYTHIVPSNENVESYERGWNDAIDAIIENEPTADVQKEIDYWHELATSYEQTIVKLSNALVESKPAVRGEWILHQDSRTWECSVCGEFDVLWRNFCHNCGADMRGGTNERE